MPYPKEEPAIVTIGEKEMIKALKEPNNQGFILVSKPKENITSKDKDVIPKETQDLLQKKSCYYY